MGHIQRRPVVHGQAYSLDMPRRTQKFNQWMDSLKTPEEVRAMIELVGTFRARAANFFSIQLKEGGIGKFKLRPGQVIVDNEYERQWSERGYVRLNILKCRQIGITTYMTRRALDYVMTTDARTALTLAHRTDQPIEWLRQCRANAKEYPEIFRAGIQTLNGPQVAFRNKSRYYISSVGSSFAGVGDTISFLHKSELCVWDKPPISRDIQKFLGPIAAAMPSGAAIKGTIDVNESTGKMVGDGWYKMWMQGKEPSNRYVNLFLPWFLVPEYRYDDLTSEILSYSPHEQMMIREASRSGFEIGRSHIAWYRTEKRDPQYGGDEIFFSAEYPTVEEEAFMAPGLVVYPAEVIELARETVREPIFKGELVGRDKDPRVAMNPANPAGELWVWEWPVEPYHYALGADCMWGKGRDTDFDALYVECLETRKVVARVYGKWSMPHWAWYIAAMGWKYNCCPVAPEINARAGQEGAGVLATLLNGIMFDRYPNIWIRSDPNKLKGHKPEDWGWHTGERSKEALISNSIASTLRGDMDWADNECVIQTGTIVHHEDGSRACPKGTHDDLWMARIITAEVARRLRPQTDLYVDPATIAPPSRTVEQRMREYDEDFIRDAYDLEDSETIVY